MEFYHKIQSVIKRQEETATLTSDYSTGNEWRGGLSSGDLFTNRPEKSQFYFISIMELLMLN